MNTFFSFAKHGCLVPSLVSHNVSAFATSMNRTHRDQLLDGASLPVNGCGALTTPLTRASSTFYANVLLDEVHEYLSISNWIYSNGSFCKIFIASLTYFELHSIRIRNDTSLIYSS